MASSAENASQPEKTTPKGSAAQKDSALLEVRVAPYVPRTGRYAGKHRKRRDTASA